MLASKLIRGDDFTDASGWKNLDEMWMDLGAEFESEGISKSDYAKSYSPYGGDEDIPHNSPRGPRVNMIDWNGSERGVNIVTSRISTRKYKGSLWALGMFWSTIDDKQEAFKTIADSFAD